MKNLSVIGLILTIIAFVIMPILFIALLDSFWGIIPGACVALFACRPTEFDRRWLWQERVK